MGNSITKNIHHTLILIFRARFSRYCCINRLLHRLIVAYDQIITYVKMLITKLLTVSHGLLPHTPPKYKKEDDESSVYLLMFDTNDDKSSVDIKIFDIDDSKSSDPDDCWHHIKKVSTSIQIFIIFISSLIISN
jgi:hypothetical protein